MGLGDNLMASGMALGAFARRKRIAFGDGKRIIWDHHSELIFRGNNNIARPGCESGRDLEWIHFYKGNRLYNKQAGDRWVWNYDFKAVPGEVFLSPDEMQFGQIGRGLVIIEPNVPAFKTVAPNKQWSPERYRVVTTKLQERGYRVAQFAHGGRYVLARAQQIKTPSFRHALAVLKNAALYIGPEGGLHHGSAAMGIAAVVLFGGFIPPAVTGYSTHTNLTGGAMACGSLRTCLHCQNAMANISVDEVVSAARGYLDNDRAQGRI